MKSQIFKALDLAKVCKISEQIFTKEAKEQRGGKSGGSSKIMRIPDYLIFWPEKIHLNLLKSLHALGEFLKVPEKTTTTTKEKTEIFLLVKNMYFTITYSLHTLQIPW